MKRIISKWGKGKRKWGTQWGVYTKKKQYNLYRDVSEIIYVQPQLGLL